MIVRWIKDSKIFLAFMLVALILCLVSATMAKAQAPADSAAYRPSLLSRVYPYWKPLSVELGDGHSRTYWKLGAGVLVTQHISASVERAWGVHELDNKWITEVKFNFR